jgi:hypothetical protein
LTRTAKPCRHLQHHNANSKRRIKLRSNEDAVLFEVPVNHLNRGNPQLFMPENAACGA